MRKSLKCAACGEPLCDELNNEEIHLHHKIPQKDGGKYSLDNIVPLHATCHESITYAKKNGLMNNNNRFRIHVLQPCAVKIARTVVRGGKLVKVYLSRLDQ
jgi:HNH endonuclease